METGSDVDTSKILEKGPEYLRRQMELESEAKGGGMSAVERLAATKPKYVKSQQVVNSTQEPALSLGSAASVSSNGSSNRSSGRGGRQAAERNSPLVAQTQGGSPGGEQENVVRRSSSKKRPDSLLLYRQKCELLKGTNGRSRRNLTRRLLEKSAALPEAADKECRSEEDDARLTRGGSGREGAALGSQTRRLLTEIPQENEATERHDAEDPTTTTTQVAEDGAQKPGHRRVAEVQRRCRKVSRSHSDVSSRYSKNFADFDAFFKYCGLEGAVVETLGKENFSAQSDDLTQKVRSASTATSDGGFSRNSDDSDGLLEEELRDSAHQGTSVIERNARIIKWLYSCKNAKETGKKLRDLD